MVITPTTEKPQGIQKKEPNRSGNWLLRKVRDIVGGTKHNFTREPPLNDSSKLMLAGESDIDLVIKNVKEPSRRTFLKMLGGLSIVLGSSSVTEIVNRFFSTTDGDLTPKDESLDLTGYEITDGMSSSELSRFSFPEVSILLEQFSEVSVERYAQQMKEAYKYARQIEGVVRTLIRELPAGYPETDARRLLTQILSYQKLANTNWDDSNDDQKRGLCLQNLVKLDAWTLSQSLIKRFPQAFPQQPFQARVEAFDFQGYVQYYPEVNESASSFNAIRLLKKNERRTGDTASWFGERIEAADFRNIYTNWSSSDIFLETEKDGQKMIYFNSFDSLDMEGYRSLLIQQGSQEIAELLDLEKSTSVNKEVDGYGTLTFSRQKDDDEIMVKNEHDIHLSPDKLDEIFARIGFARLENLCWNSEGGQVVIDGTAFIFAEGEEYQTACEIQTKSVFEKIQSHWAHFEDLEQKYQVPSTLIASLIGNELSDVKRKYQQNFQLEFLGDMKTFFEDPRTDMDAIVPLLRAIDPEFDQYVLSSQNEVQDDYRRRVKRYICRKLGLIDDHGEVNSEVVDRLLDTPLVQNEILIGFLRGIDPKFDQQIIDAQAIDAYNEDKLPKWHLLRRAGITDRQRRVQVDETTIENIGALMGKNTSIGISQASIDQLKQERLIPILGRYITADTPNWMVVLAMSDERVATEAAFSYVRNLINGIVDLESREKLLHMPWIPEVFGTHVSQHGLSVQSGENLGTFPILDQYLPFYFNPLDWIVTQYSGVVVGRENSYIRHEQVESMRRIPVDMMTDANNHWVENARQWYQLFLKNAEQLSTQTVQSKDQLLDRLARGGEYVRI